MTKQEAIYQQEYLKEMHNATPEVIEACEMAIHSLEAWDEVIKEMQSRKATYPTPIKENWNKEAIARNSGIDECIEIVNKYLKIEVTE